jgi:hypothetical protein
MRHYFILIFFVVVFSSQIFAQDSGNKDSSKVDTTKSASNNLNSFFDSNLFEPQLYYDNDIKKWKIFIPQYSLRSNFEINSKYLYLDDLKKKSVYTYSDDELESFKESINILMALGYKDYTKYDLGELGKYLGISQKLMAIILGILTVLK